MRCIIFGILYRDGRRAEFLEWFPHTHAAGVRRLDGIRSDPTGSNWPPPPRERPQPRHARGLAPFRDKVVNGTLKTTIFPAASWRARANPQNFFHHQNFRRDAFGRRGDAPAQAEHGQTARARFQHLGGFRAAHQAG